MADRESVESLSDEILDGAEEVDIAFLVVGDPFGYTLHLPDLTLEIDSLQELQRTLTSSFGPVSGAYLSKPSTMPPSCPQSVQRVCSFTILGKLSVWSSLRRNGSRHPTTTA